MNFELTKTKFSFKKSLCSFLAVVLTFACIQPCFSAIASFTGENVTAGNVTGGNVTGGNVTDGNVTDGNVTDGNVTDGNVTDGNVTDGNTGEVPCEHIWVTDGCFSVEPTCLQDGYQGTVCSICGVSGEVIILTATGHTVVIDEAVEPTCTQTGLTEGSHCSSCDLVFEKQIVIPETGHTVSDWIKDKESSCSEEGSRHKECTVCKLVLETESIKITPHKKYVWVVDKEATCTSTGSIHRECADCHQVMESLVISQKGHSPSSWITDKKASVHSTGAKHKECKLCHTILQKQTIPQLKCATPKLNSVINTATGVKITWNKVNGADSYTVYRKVGKGNWIAIKGNITATSFTDTGAVSGTTYQYTVKARNEAGFSAYNTKGLTIKYLNDPVLKTITSTKAGVNLKWNKVNGAEGYVIYRKTSNGKFTKIATVSGVSKVTYTDKNAKKGVTYTYKIKAFSGNTFSAQSNIKSIKDKY